MLELVNFCRFQEPGDCKIIFVLRRKRCIVCTPHYSFDEGVVYRYQNIMSL